MANPWWPAQNIVGVSYVEADHHAFVLAQCNLLLNDEDRGSFPHANFGDVGHWYVAVFGHDHPVPPSTDPLWRACLQKCPRPCRFTRGLGVCVEASTPKITHQIFLPRLPSRSNSSSCAPGFRDAKLKSSPFSIINLILFRRSSDANNGCAVDRFWTREHLLDQEIAAWCRPPAKNKEGDKVSKPGPRNLKAPYPCGN